MKKEINLYYREVIRRNNMLKVAVLSFVLAFASYPRMVLEVFVRKNFGRRYFRLSSVLTVTALLIIIPQITRNMGSIFSRGHGSHEGYISWYIFTALFFIFSCIRLREIENGPSVFDFTKFTLYSGDINPKFYKLKIFGQADIRDIETLYEPFLFYLVTFILYLFDQKLCYLIGTCSTIYSLSYFAAYQRGDDFVMDIIDEILMNEERYNAIVLDEPADKCRGVRFHMDRPDSLENRERLSEHFIQTETVAMVS